MEFFIEPFKGYVIRIGPDARQRPDPYVWDALISEDGKWLITREGEQIIPLSDDGEFGPVSTFRLNKKVVRAALEAAKSLRIKNPRWQHKGEITMPHKHAHEPHKTKADGTLDQDAVRKNLESYMDAVKSGKVQILAIGEPLPVPGMDGVSAKTFIVKE